MDSIIRIDVINNKIVPYSVLHISENFVVKTKIWYLFRFPDKNGNIQVANWFRDGFLNTNTCDITTGVLTDQFISPVLLNTKSSNIIYSNGTPFIMVRGKLFTVGHVKIKTGEVKRLSTAMAKLLDYMIVSIQLIHWQNVSVLLYIYI